MSDKVDVLAQRMCENLGLHPHEVVQHDYGADMTAAERVDALGGSVSPDVTLFSPRWRLYRPKAAAFLALMAAYVEIDKEDR